eukprot:COSAG01_NODE_52822_length_343_cov_30.131148_1_plen_30_part_10
MFEVDAVSCLERARRPGTSIEVMRWRGRRV